MGAGFLYIFMCSTARDCKVQFIWKDQKLKEFRFQEINWIGGIATIVIQFTMPLLVLMIFEHLAY